MTPDLYPEVKDHGDRMVFYVRSRTRHQHWHIVDLASKNYQGNGECNCKNFRIVCHTNFKENGGKVVPFHFGNNDRTQCGHIAAAWFHFAQQISTAMIGDKGI